MVRLGLTTATIATAGGLFGWLLRGNRNETQQKNERGYFVTDLNNMPVGRAQVKGSEINKFSTNPSDWEYIVRIDDLAPLLTIPSFQGLRQVPITIDNHSRISTLKTDEFGNIVSNSKGEFPKLLAFAQVATQGNRYGLKSGELAGISLYDTVKIASIDEDAENSTREDNQRVAATFFKPAVIAGMRNNQIESSGRSDWISPLPIAIDDQILAKTTHNASIIARFYWSKSKGFAEFSSTELVSAVNDPNYAQYTSNPQDSVYIIANGYSVENSQEIAPNTSIIMQATIHTPQGTINPFEPYNLLGFSNDNITNIPPLIGIWNGSTSL